MQFKGDQFVPLPPEAVWPRLSDAAFLAGSLTDVEVTRAEHDFAAWKVRPALAFAAGTLDITMAITDRVPPSEMRAKLVSKGIGATSTVQTHLSLTPQDEGTKIHWEAAITELTGLLKMVPKGLIESSARKVIEDVWANMAARLTNEPKV